MVTRGTKQIRLGRVQRMVKSLEVEKGVWLKRLEDAEQKYLDLGFTPKTIAREVREERGRVEQLERVLSTILEHFAELKELKEGKGEEGGQK